MQKRLTWLIFATGIAMLGIIALQIFWLHTSYKDQQNRFNANVENALMETTILSRLQPVLTTNQQLSGHQLANSITSMIGDVISNIKTHKESSSPVMAVMYGQGDTIPDTGLRNVIQEAIRNNKASDTTVESTHFKPANINYYKTLIAATLEKKQINTPVEIALLSKKDKIIECSTDSNTFKNIAMKSIAEAEGIPITLDSDGNKLQLAFPYENAYILKQIAWILLLSIFLTIAYILSFCYMVALFLKQKKIAEIKNDFMNNMTHELKTPISAISVAIELVQDTQTTATTEQKNNYLHIAQNELKRLTMLVEKVLKMAAFEKSEIVITKENISAKQWLAGIINSFNPIIQSDGAIIKDNIQPETLKLFADRTHLTNVMQNLLDNAIKYNDKPEPLIEIKLWENDTQNFIQVSDNGMGIPAAYISRVFEKFFRVPSGDKHDTKGYGLGLSYVKAIADLHQGTIEVKSIQGRGSTFTITIPKQ